MIVTNSELTCFRACPRKHRYRYLDLIRPISDSSPKRNWGHVIHAALERHLLGEDWAPVVRDSQLDPHAKAAALAVLVGYTAFWANDSLRILGVELEFAAPVICPDSLRLSSLYTSAGKMDALVADDSDGHKWIVEHKNTTADISHGSPYWQRLRIDSQISTYVDGAKALGHDVEGVIYDVLRRPTLEPYRATPEANRKYTKGTGCLLCGGKKLGVQGRGCAACKHSGWFLDEAGQPTAPRLYANQHDHDETPDEYALRIAAHIAEDPTKYYQRARVVRLDRELAEARRDTWEVTHAIATGITNYRNPDACMNFGDRCEYFDVCTGAASLDDHTRFYRATKAHSELTTLTTKEVTNHASSHTDHPF